MAATAVAGTSHTIAIVTAMPTRKHRAATPRNAIVMKSIARTIARAVGVVPRAAAATAVSTRVPGFQIMLEDGFPIGIRRVARTYVARLALWERSSHPLGSSW